MIIIQQQEFGMTSIEIDEYDLVISRAQNGWIVRRLSENDSETIISSVFTDSEDADFNFSAACSLQDLIYEHFECYMQSKRSAGLVLELEKKGWSEE